MFITTPMLIMFAAACILHTVESCQTLHLRNRLMGFGCAWGNNVNFTGVAEHECVLRCMSDKSCTAVNYDVQDRVCMRMEVPCPVLEIQQYVHYQILAAPPVDDCVQWIPTGDWDYPRMVKYNSDPNGYQLHGVARLTRAGEVLPARWSKAKNIAYTVQNNTKFVSSVFEVLVVKKSCSVRWVNYDASSGNPLPPGAILGGHLADGMPLYVAITCLSANWQVAGYYNHETRTGTCQWGLSKNNQGNIKILATL